MNGETRTQKAFPAGILTAAGGLITAALCAGQTLVPWFQGELVSISPTFFLTELLLAVVLTIAGFSLMVMGASPVDSAFDESDREVNLFDASADSRKPMGS